MMYGSPHDSAPSLRRYDVSPGDFIFIVGLKAGLLSLVTRAGVSSSSPPTSTSATTSSCQRPP